MLAIFHNPSPFPISIIDWTNQFIGYNFLYGKKLYNYRIIIIVTIIWSLTMSIRNFYDLICTAENSRTCVNVPVNISFGRISSQASSSRPAANSNGTRCLITFARAKWSRVTDLALSSSLEITRRKPESTGHVLEYLHNRVWRRQLRWRRAYRGSMMSAPSTIRSSESYSNTRVSLQPLLTRVQAIALRRTSICILWSFQSVVKQLL